MMTLRYVGPYDAVEIEWPVGAMTTVARGTTIELPARIAGASPTEDDPGAGLLAQPGNWELVAAAAPRKKGA